MNRPGVAISRKGAMRGVWRGPAAATVGSEEVGRHLSKVEASG